MSNPEQIVQRFSTYLDPKDGHSGTKPTPIPNSGHTLKTFMESLVESQPNASEEDWARYFLKVLLEARKNYQFLALKCSNLAVICFYILFLLICHQLLFSYLQLVCFYAAKQTSARLKLSPSLKLHYPLEECFLIASEAALKPAKLLKRFDFNSNFPLYGYARTALNRVIQNQVAKDLKTNSVKLSDNGLLHSLTSTKLRKALKAYGILSREIAKYLLAWQSFNDLYEEFYRATSSSGSRRNSVTAPLNERQLALVATRFNERLKLLKIEQQPLSIQEIQKLLKICVRAVRTFQNKQLVSLDVYDRVGDCQSQTNAIAREERDEIARVRNVIMQKFEALDELAQKTLLLWLGLELNQNEFLSVLNLKQQYQVTRRFQQYQKILLKGIVERFAREYSLDSLNDKQINQLCKSKLSEIKEYLMLYSRDYFSQGLANILTTRISDEEKQILIQNHSPSPNPGKNCSHLSIKVREVKNKLQKLLKEDIEKRLKIRLSQFSSAERCLEKFIDNWLQSNIATLYN